MTDRNMKVHAEPTKDFFIHMLTRDIGLSRSILDLVDNCVDGALRVRGEGRFGGLHISMQLSEDHFKIEDNCGGIPLDLAQNYAFRFGRPREAEVTKHSIGQFGVGMKRALFKLGTEFRIESTSPTSHFILSGDVEEWLSRPEDWTFEFTEVDEPEGGYQADSHGTIISVTQLHVSVADTFGLENFRNELSYELKEAHRNALEKGISISLNGIPIDFDPVDLLASDELKPVYRSDVISISEDTKVRVQICAGIAESEPQDAGWYIFCNGRLVLGADKSEVTGWGAEGETEVPRFHNRSARFRGYVFFDADDAGLLPWNTTKTGVDSDAMIYRSIRRQMISIMRPIIDFLNKLSREVESDEVEKPLMLAVETARKLPLSDLEPIRAFMAPRSRQVSYSGPPTGVISYRKTLDEIAEVQRVLGVSTQKEVGEMTFQYFFDLECRG